ncbi:MAG: hypothetical protein IPL88_16020 [Rhizobiales bacterium]|nr:hypothetical protein [Hyphomicrobiales bacterium]
MKAAFAGGSFDEFAKLDDKGLVVRQPAGRNGGTGALSTQSALRFEDLGDDAETTVSYRFDPAGTSSVMLSLCPAHAHHCGSEPGLTLYWRRTKDGAGALIWTWPSGAKKEARTAASLESVVIRLTRKGARVEAAGATLEGGVDALRPRATFEIGAMAVTPVEGEGADMALLSVDVAETHGAARRAQPAPGVEPLDVAPVFAGRDSGAWKPLAVSGGDFAAFARYAEGGLLVDVPKQRNWATTGLVSAAPVLRVAEESGRAPALARLTFDPTRSKSFAVVLTRAPTDDLWFKQVIWASYAAGPDGSGRLTASFCASPVRVWGLDVPPGWDGRLEIEAAAGFGLVRLAPGYALGGYLDCVTEGQSYHLNVVAHAPAEHAPASMLLRRVEIGRLTPDGMTAMDRLELVDDDAFDPRTFLDVAADRLGKAQGAPQ